MRWTILFLVLTLSCSALSDAPAAEGQPNPDCVYEYRGGVACTVNWNASDRHKTACDVITEAVAVRAFDGPAARPVHISILLSGWIHAKSLDVCELNSLVQAGAVRRTITLYVYYPPLERGDWPRYFRDGLTSTRDVAWPAATAYWAKDAIGEEQPNLYVFDNRAHVFVKATGFADDDLSLEKAKIIASAALTVITR